MSGDSNLLAASFLTQGISNFGTSYAQATAQQLQSDLQQSQLEANAKIAEWKAKDALKRGSKEANKQRGAIKRLIGSQRAGFAAQGIDVNEGTAAAIQNSTSYLGELDNITIRTNAFREAWGYKFQAQDYRNQSYYAGAAGSNLFSGTILTGASQFAGSVLQAGYYTNFSSSKKGKS